MIAFVWIAAGLMMVPVGGEMLGARIILPVQHQFQKLGKRLHPQKKLKRRDAPKEPEGIRGGE